MRQFGVKLANLTPLLDRHNSLVKELENLIDFAAYTEPQRSDTKVIDRYLVSYHGNIRGIHEVEVTRNIVLKQTSFRGVGVGGKTIASRNYGLLTGEIFQYIAKLVLETMTVDRHRIRKVAPLQIPKERIGERVDDWILTINMGETIPAEVKASRGLSYFDKAFRQIKMMKEFGSRGVFIGFKLGRKQNASQKILVVLVEKADTLTSFKKSIREMISKEQ